MCVYTYASVCTCTHIPTPAMMRYNREVGNGRVLIPDGFHSVCMWIPVVLVHSVGNSKRVKCMGSGGSQLEFES